MRRRRAALAIALGLSIGPAAAAGDGLVATLTAGLEITTTVPGGRGANGTAFISVEGRRVMLSIVVAGLDDIPTAVHLHQATDGAGGPVVIPFFGPGSERATWSWWSARSMEATVPAELATDLVAHPERYALDVHAADSPEPAIRGALSRTSARSAAEAGVHLLPPAPGAIGAVGVVGGTDRPPALPAAAPPLRGFPRGAAPAPRGAGPFPIGMPARGEEAASPEPRSAAPRTEQTIRIGRLPRLVYGDPDAPLDARATSGLPVSFTATGDCSMRGSSLHVVSAGHCLVTAHQYGNATWSPVEAEARIQIEKAGQQIWMQNLYPRTYLDPDVDLGATATSGLPVVVLAYGDCAVVSRATLRITGAGTCTISVHQPGDSNYTAAPILDGSFVIARADQSIDTPEIPQLTSRAAYPLRFSASSGLPVRISTTGPCSVTESNLEPLGTGTCTVWYEQDGDRNFNAAPTVKQLVRITLPD